MLSQCPHCQQKLALTEAQQTKVEKALAALESGKVLKINCPQCKKPIELAANGTQAKASAGDDDDQKVLKEVLYSEHTGDEDRDIEDVVAHVRKVPKPTKIPPAAPKAPDVSWLAEGEFTAEEVVRDVPLAMILMADGQERSKVAEAFSELGYQTEFANSAETAIERMRFVNFAAVVMNSGFEGRTLADSTFHAYMRTMTMDTRRYIYYIVIGPEFRTLYDLEALSNSANLVVNEQDAAHMNVILKKGMQDYDNLFGPYIEMLKGQGRI